MPARLRPTAPFADDAILVGDPGRALALAQELLVEPRMSNHARGLWGYSGRTAADDALSVQATGMGGPSAGVVLRDLAELGVRRAVRIGSCHAIDPDLSLGDLLVVAEAHSWAGPAGTSGEAVLPAPALTAGLSAALGAAAKPGTVASLDVPYGDGGPTASSGVAAADMQTATVLAGAAALEIEAAAVLIVTESASRDRAGDEQTLAAAKLAGRAAAGILAGAESTP